MALLSPFPTRRRRRQVRRALDVRAPDVSAGFGPGDRLYFLHIHKTAGSMLARILETHFGQGEICPPQTWQRFRELSPAELAQYRLFRGHLLHFTHWLPERPWVVTFLRDPVERTLSTYDYVRRNERHRHHRAALEMDLATFLDDPDTSGTVRDLQTRWILANAFPCDSLLDMERGLDDLGLDPLETAQGQLDSYAFVGLVERFEESVQRLMDTMGWHLFDWMTEHAADRVNVSEGRLQRDDLDPAVLERILDLTTLDRRLHDWALARFDAAPPPPSTVDTSPFSATPSTTVDLDFSRAVPGFGWQTPEVHPETGIGFRWMGPLPEATLFLPLEGGRDLDLTLAVPKAITDEVLDGLRLDVNGTPVDLARRHPGPPLVLAGTIPAAAVSRAGETTRLRLTVPTMASPASLGRAPDRRRLGVAFSELRIRPAA